MTNAEILGNKLYELRKSTGLSQEELADKLGVSRQAISKWERGEALPDTANLIALAKLYKVSLDELIENEPQSKSTDSKEETNDSSQSNDESEKVEVEVNSNGIKVDIQDEEDKVKVNVSPVGITVNVDCEDDDGEEYYSYNSQPTSKKRTMLRLLHNLPYPIIATIAFLLWGFLGQAFHVSWTLFITIPVYYTLIDCFRLKRVSHFAYPVFITFIYLLLGMQWGLWHPHWVMFLTIPVFYPIANAIDKKD